MIWGIALLGKYPEQVQFFDTTLRDGEQTPGISLTPPKKLEIAQALDSLGVNVIEAGFAAVSPGEREAVELISNAGLDAEVCSATRSVIKDIDVAIDAGVDSVNIIIPVSELHVKRKFNKEQAWILDVTSNVVQHAKDRGVVAEICLEDGSRTKMDFLRKVIQRALDAGVDRVTPCDTVGTLTPERSLEYYGALHEMFPDMVLGVHVHNDFGLATANTIAGVAGGATHIHATINGLGERAGNASLEENCVALELLYKVKTGINMQRITSTSHTVSRVTGMQVQPNKAIVGRNAFAHESGIHTHAILRDPTTYERIDPALVGATRRLVSGKHAGSTGLFNNLMTMGLEPSEAQFNEILEQVKSLGDKGTLISDTDLYEIASKVMDIHQQNPLVVDEFIVTTGNKITPTASIKVTRNGDSYMEAATGNGPVDATLNALVKAVAIEDPVELELYQVEAITGGTNAVVNVEVRLRQGDRVVTSRGVNEDIVLASVNAYLNGVNLYQNMKKDRQ
ncbi:2-isopropylmalate synthase [Candidatus Bathyarchaeota archaeon]|nr:MAG: 2-isopropylmalate synthase [Candidatus Bathyarchaeota archaeon]